ncbi:MAG TPA: acetylxylan esterase, partial [Armatimonadota bacterium]|nr:acetylxylan esterase [Armatimonadota bacterium]
MNRSGRPEAELQTSLPKFLAGLSQTCREENRSARESIAAPEDWRKARGNLEGALLDCLGGLPELREPLNSRLCGEVQGPGYRMAQVAYESLPGLHVSASLYLPETEGQHPGVTIQCGLTSAGKAEAAIQRLAIELATNGMAALVADPVGQGERASYRTTDGMVLPGGGACEQAYLDGPCRLAGASLVSYMVYECSRALDLLAALPAVDADHLGVVGHEQGCLVALLAAALDERVGSTCLVAAPAWHEQVEAGRVLAPGGLLRSGLDLAALCALVAPRPLRIIRGGPESDDGDDLSFARRVYAHEGQPGNLDCVWCDGARDLSSSARARVREWLARSSGVGVVEEPLADPPWLPVEDTWVTPEGRIEELGGHSFFHIHRALARAQITARPSQDPEQVAAAVSSIVGRGPAVASEPLTRPRSQEDGLQVEDVWLEVDEGLRCAGVVVGPEDRRGGPGVVWLHGRGDAGLAAHWDRVRDLAGSGVRVLAFWPRGTGPEAPREIAGQSRLAASLLGVESQWARQALMCGQSLAAMRARDITSAVAYLISRPEVDSASVYVCAEG